MLNTILNIYVDGCNFTKTPFDIGSNITTEIEWPETSLGDTASVPCPCAKFAGSLAGRAYSYCSGTFSLGAHWDEFDVSRCEVLNSMTTRRLCVAALLLAQVAISHSNAPLWLQNYEQIHILYRIQGKLAKWQRKKHQLQKT